jgi:O-antigen/teichoic acid export membrane protein
MLGTVTYPILATLQNDKERLTSVYRKYIKTATLPIACGCLLITALAQPLVHFCFGAQWLPCVIYVQLVSCAMMFDHISTINLSLLQVLGRSDILLGLEITKKSILLLMILYAATISVPAMCSVSLVYGQVAIFINSYFISFFIEIFPSSLLCSSKSFYFIYYPHFIILIFNKRIIKLL